MPLGRREQGDEMSDFSGMAGLADMVREIRAVGSNIADADAKLDAKFTRSRAVSTRPRAARARARADGGAEAELIAVAVRCQRLAAGIRSEFKDEPPMHSLDLLAGISLAATEIIAKHDVLDVRAALLEQVGSCGHWSLLPGSAALYRALVGFQMDDVRFCSIRQPRQE